VRAGEGFNGDSRRVLIRREVLDTSSVAARSLKIFVERRPMPCTDAISSPRSRQATGSMYKRLERINPAAPGFAVRCQQGVREATSLPAVPTRSERMRYRRVPRRLRHTVSAPLQSGCACAKGALASRLVRRGEPGGAFHCHRRGRRRLR